MDVPPGWQPELAAGLQDGNIHVAIVGDDTLADLDHAKHFTSAKQFIQWAEKPENHRPLTRSENFFRVVAINASASETVALWKLVRRTSRAAPILIFHSWPRYFGLAQEEERRRRKPGTSRTVRSSFLLCILQPVLSSRIVFDFCIQRETHDQEDLLRYAITFEELDAVNVWAQPCDMGKCSCVACA